ncbi:putative THR4-threonine synthase [Ceraceosorus guamensis]|uniref:threonine synthase n=1 Tax=Ceraceosorus guamensis TaxID=1522189 RepID=A0A316W2J1_9BASI|nr:putative THR4-threonine synthase [Ceraceosorus guamensis]PWN43990.1 putative THR4-threonine synthase [Ceraceosorus guamensis]
MSGMRYLSTRGGAERLTFEEAVLRGLAPNGGLYIPVNLPSIPADWSTRWRNLSFPALSFEILSLFIPPTAEEGGIQPADLKALLEKSYSEFRDPKTTPLKKLNSSASGSAQEWCLELWHGPTFAFKDVALQTLGNLFEYFLQRRNAGKAEGERQKLTVVGATSGDTGSAAIAGLRSKADISIFILHPKGRVSPIQEAQMTTVLDANVHNLAVEGTFDDCQDVVKALFSDAQFNAKHRLGAINSINFARILAQIVYYFSAWFQLLQQTGEASPDIEFVVPTGNFGDILAGYYAKRMGLPVTNLVVATNENDILQRFWSTGAYEKEASGDAGASQTEPAQGSSDGAQAGTAKDASGVKATLSPAMDILVSSNFERLLWYIASETASGSDREGDAGKQLAQWMKELKEQGRFQVDKNQLEVARRDFEAERVSDKETKETILRYFNAPPSYLIDPHTAVGFCAANRLSARRAGAKHQVVLSTAHPAKFSEAVTSSLESAGASFDFERDVLPKEMHGLLEKERRVRDVKLADADSQSAPKVERLVEATKKVIELEAGKVSAAQGKGTESV